MGSLASAGCMTNNLSKTPSTAIGHETHHGYIVALYSSTFIVSPERSAVEHDQSVLHGDIPKIEPTFLQSISIQSKHPIYSDKLEP